MDLVDFVDIEQAADVISQLWGNPHFDHGCELTMEVSACGLVYCADCASQVGSVPQSFAGIKVGRGGKSERWLRHEAIEQAWKAGDKKHAS